MANEALPLLPETVITTAVTGQASTAVPLGRGALGNASLSAEAVFTYGSGGTSAKAWIQTTLDNGTTWIDVMCFAFTTASGVKVSAVSTEIAPASQAFTPSDGALADNTVIQGVLGDQVRVKLTTVGTYAGGTKLAIWLTRKGGAR